MKQIEAQNVTKIRTPHTEAKFPGSYKKGLLNDIKHKLHWTRYKFQLIGNKIQLNSIWNYTIIIAAISDIRLSRRWTWKIDIVDCKIQNLRILPMSLSARILTFYIFRESSTSFPETCDFPLVKWGIFKIAPWEARVSAILKPRSANIRSPCCKNLRNPECIVISLSETRPPHPLERKLTAPAGVIAIKYLMVLVFL